MQLRYSPRPPYGFICIEGVLYFGKSTTEHRNGVFEPFWGHFLRATVGPSVRRSVGHAFFFMANFERKHSENTQSDIQSI